MADAMTPPESARSDSAAVLQAIQLTKFYGERPALRDVSFVLQAGDCLALLGHNGAGKTTLLHMLALISRPTAGRVLIGGVEAAGAQRQHLRGRIGLLGHQTFLYDELTARENLAFYAGLYGAAGAGERIARELETAGLAEAAGELVRHFSRGMRQRLALARAFLHDPPVVLLDEPFTGLDQAGVRMLCARVEHCRAERRTVVLSSHDVELALSVATHVLELDHSRVTRLERNERLRPELDAETQRAQR